MRTLTITEAATVAEIDEALDHLRQIPPDERGPAWQAYTDKLLEMRATQTDTTTPTRQAQ